MGGCHSPAERRLVQKAKPRAGAGSCSRCCGEQTQRGCSCCRALQDRGAAPKGLCGEAESKLLLAGELSLCDRRDGLVYFILCVAKKKERKEKKKRKKNPAATKQRSDTALLNRPRSEVSLLAPAQLPSLLRPCLSSSFTWQMKL